MLGNTGPLPELPAVAWIGEAAWPCACSISFPPTSECEYLTAKDCFGYERKRVDANSLPPPLKGESTGSRKELHLSSLLSFVGAPFPHRLFPVTGKNGYKTSPRSA